MFDRSSNETGRADVAVVGGGLGGLATAALLAREGRSVVLFERARAVGGRAMTTSEDGFLLNLGPHALYGDGAAIHVSRNLGIEPRGVTPEPDGALGLSGGELHPFPATATTFLTSRILTAGAKIEAVRVLLGLRRLDTRPLARVKLADWAASAIRRDDARRLVLTVLRVATYAADHDRISAGAAIAQFQMADRKGVSYLHGGWQTLVDRLRETAERYGARIVSGARVASVDHDHRALGVTLADDTRISAETVVLAAGPREVAALLPKLASFGASLGGLRPVRAACLDLALETLPRPDARIALGIDRPLYLSVHSSFASLAPTGGAVIHAAKYLSTGEDARDAEREIEALVDLAQPGWRSFVAARRFMPTLTVTNALPTAEIGGLAGRPSPTVPGVDGLYVVGDWVGDEGMLADAALASAREAARLVLGARATVNARPGSAVPFEALRIPRRSAPARP